MAPFRTEMRKASPESRHQQAAQVEQAAARLHIHEEIPLVVGS
jgi:hypothetical protein